MLLFSKQQVSSRLISKRTPSISLVKSFRPYFSTNQPKETVNVDAEESHEDFKPRQKPNPNKEYENLFPEIEKVRNLPYFPCISLYFLCISLYFLVFSCISFVFLCISFVFACIFTHFFEIYWKISRL